MGHYAFPSSIGFEELPRITLLHRLHLLRSPASTISPLASPPPGPISMREAADVITFGSCPVTTTVLPFLLRRRASMSASGKQREMVTIFLE